MRGHKTHFQRKFAEDSTFPSFFIFLTDNPRTVSTRQLHMATIISEANGEMRSRGMEHIYGREKCTKARNHVSWATPYGLRNWTARQYGGDTLYTMRPSQWMATRERQEKSTSYRPLREADCSRSNHWFCLIPADLFKQPPPRTRLEQLQRELKKDDSCNCFQAENEVFWQRQQSAPDWWLLRLVPLDWAIPDNVQNHSCWIWLPHCPIKRREMKATALLTYLCNTSSCGIFCIMLYWFW